MPKIDVVAKVDGVHAVTGLGLTAGETYTITEDQFGDEVFEKAKPEEEGRGRKKQASKPESGVKEV